MPFYEMIIEFKDENEMKAFCSKNLKESSHRDGWKWTTKEGYAFKAWNFGKKLVLALALPSTEWWGEWD